LRTTLETLWFEPGKPGCIAELCLLADPKACYGAGRYKFADLFIPRSGVDAIASPCIELKNASLPALFQGMGNNSNGTPEQLEELRREISMLNEEDLLSLKVNYDQKYGDGMTINEMKNLGFQQVKHYVDLIRQGKSNGLQQGVYDYRVRCKRGQSTLIGYVVICVGATKVLAWKVVDKECGHFFMPTVPTKV